MTIAKLFFGYMTLIGLAIGAIVVAVPRVMEFWIKPYFWVIIAVALFDAAVYLKVGKRPHLMLSMDARLIGFVIGVVLMVLVPTLAGSPARFF